MFAPPIKAPKAKTALPSIPTRAPQPPQHKFGSPAAGLSNQATLTYEARSAESLAGRKSDELHTPAEPSRVAFGAVPNIVDAALRSPGQPLDTQTRAYFEPRFRHDFSGVQVHTDATAARSAQALGAKAYTVDQHVVFGTSKPPATSTPGQMLLAHELAHVVQQSRGGPAPELNSSAPHERDAHAAATRVAFGLSTVKVACSTGIGIARENGEHEGWPEWARRDYELALHFEDLVENCHLRGLKAVYLLDQWRPMIKALVSLGENAGPPGSTEELFDRGAETFAKKYHLEKQLSRAALRGDVERRERFGRQKSLHEEFGGVVRNGLPGPGSMTLEETPGQHEAFEQARSECARIRLCGKARRSGG